MPRKLKTYITTSGFFDLAVAAPSMKAATEIWGSRSNPFQQGFAQETDDPVIVKAALAHPGVILRRPVGTKTAFKEQAETPNFTALERAAKPVRKPAPPPKKKPVKQDAKQKKPDAAANRQAAQLYDLAQKRRERDEQSAEAERKKARERREQVIAKAQATLDTARGKHDERLKELEAQRDALDRKMRVERERWQDEKQTLETALKRAGD
jgi:hypothetical protein